jgi:hypothetical protein
MKSLAVAACVAALAISHAFAQTTNRDAAICVDGAALAGIVRDSTGATVAAATVTLGTGEVTTTAGDGRFHFRCVAGTVHTLHVAAESFAATDVDLSRLRRETEIAVVLHPEAVQQNVDVNASDVVPGVDKTDTGQTRTLQGDDLKALADDPDDLLRELQQMTAGSGGDPSAAMITVDGFQMSGRLPPKSSIAFIKVNPDLFAAEYGEPPYTGGRVEVYTKAGQPRHHGALFMTYGGSALNASDPFSTASKGKLGKQRFGAELSGPVRKVGSDFALSLEHRIINNVAVVNAVTLDADGNQVPVNETVAAPQTMWSATARLGWQLGPKNTFSATYQASVNSVVNMGVGGTTLPEAGRDDQIYEHTLRFVNVTTAGPNFMHEARFAVRWLGDISTPHSTGPQVQVAGAFTGGGAELGAQKIREFGSEINDDVILTSGPHTLKAGINMRIYRERNQMTQNFNGTYVFGGGIAPALDANGNPIPGSTIAITGIEQYRRALLGLSGGTPTAYTVVTGTPDINYTQARAALFAEDDWKLKPNLKFSFGARYFIQNEPLTLLNLVPRAGFTWAPDKKQTWTLKLHAGMFSGTYTTEDATELRRLDGTHRTLSTIYSPVYGNPFAGATPISTIRSQAPGLTAFTFSEEQFEVDKVLPHGWNLMGTVYWLRGWNQARSPNVNSPLNDLPTGPRPGPANMNILQTQNSASMKGPIYFVSVEQHALKRFGIFFGFADVDLRDNADGSTFFAPQSSSTDEGEYGRRTFQDQYQAFGNAMLHLPGKVDVSAEYSGGSGKHFNLTTGFDNNGDGNFNDRPTYAKPGDPSAIATRYGLLVATGGTGVVPRNTGTMPFRIYLDGNVSRVFTLTPHAKKDQMQTLSVNIRAANVLNHVNVRGVGGVLGSPLFGQAYTADTGRRVEIGARYSF